MNEGILRPVQTYTKQELVRWLKTKRKAILALKT